MLGRFVVGLLRCCGCADSGVPDAAVVPDVVPDGVPGVVPGVVPAAVPDAHHVADVPGVPDVVVAVVGEVNGCVLILVSLCCWCWLFLLFVFVGGARVACCLLGGGGGGGHRPNCSWLTD